MKCTLLLTQMCNLRCDYCYITKRLGTMDLETANMIIDYIYDMAYIGEKISIGYFGGEPLLEFELMKTITCMIKEHENYRDHDVEFSVITNGTILDDEIIEFINEHNLGFGISCDGIPEIQNMHRKFVDGGSSASIVEQNIIKGCKAFGQNLVVNSVYSPTSYMKLHETVEYLYGLGVRKIYLNMDYSGKWSQEEAKELKDVYKKIGDLFISYYEQNDPAVISVIDNKIAVIIGKGYKEENLCHMGKKEFAFSPEGNIFPCERLVGDGRKNSHCIGDVYSGGNYSRVLESCHMHESPNEECSNCTLKDYCMNWCGCSNFMASHYYNRVSGILCASEKAAIEIALDVINKMDDKYGAHLIPMLAKSD